MSNNLLIVIIVIFLIILVSLQYSLNKIIVILKELKDILYQLNGKQR
ncbi:hypothetical protein RH915_08620 [Serpentinicella sp. ANB-PHB4]|nr:hypothetical protein [Serpentinicella sp. ANB-PHB4]MDR5659555.1 hypothetical protein [Serpentinicella sp. ANB-PHB4]